MKTPISKVLFLPKWYPNVDDVQLGIFIKRHAQAVALHAEVNLVFVHATKIDVGFKESHEDNFNTVIYYFYKKIRVLRFLKMLLSYYKLLSKMSRPDAVHIHVLGWQAIIGYWFAKKWKVPFYITEHWTGYYSGGFAKLGFVERKVYQYLFQHADKVSVVSPFLEEHICKHLGNRAVEIIGNVVTTPLKSVDEKSKVIIIVSDLRDDMKNISGTIQAFHKSAVSELGWKLRIIGDGKDMQKLVLLVEELGLSDKVDFMGRLAQPQVVEQIAKSSFLIVNSRFETFSVVIIESLALGVPVITTRCGGPDEFFKTDAGMFVEVDDNEQLTRAIKKMIVQYESYNIKAMHAISDQFTLDNISKLMMDFYQQ